MNSTYNSTGIDNLIKKYQNEISTREEQIKHNQLQIEKDSNTICHLNNKIQTLRDLIVELNNADKEETAAKTANKATDLNSAFKEVVRKTTENKTNGFETKTPATSSVWKDPWNHPDWSAEKTWSECSKELNKLLEDLNKKHNATQLEFYGGAFWPADLGA